MADWLDVNGSTCPPSLTRQKRYAYITGRRVMKWSVRRGMRALGKRPCALAIGIAAHQALVW